MFPLLIIPVVLYNVLVLFGTDMAVHIVRLPLFSGARWPISFGDLLIFLSLGLLFAELMRATNVRTALPNHWFSIGVFALVLAEFLLWRPFATSAFFGLLMMTVFDFAAGFGITILAARRDISVVRDHGIH